jgi:hypothetical protein
MVRGMNLGFQPPGDAIFLVKCTDYKCLAVQGTNGQWKSYYDDIELPDVTEVILSVPFELVRPFIPDAKLNRLSPIPLRMQQ